MLFKIHRRVMHLIILLLLSADILLMQPTASQAALTQQERDHNIEFIYHFLRDELLLSPAASAGILANIDRECSFDPTDLTTYGSTVSYGIMQWTDNSEVSHYTSLKNWCAEHGYDYTTLGGQLNYLQAELSDKTLYDFGPKTYGYMLGAAVYHSSFTDLDYPVEDTQTGAYNAGYVWCRYYERPSDKENESFRRAELARDTYWDLVETLEGKVSMKDCSIKLRKSSYAYTGHAITPAVTATYNDCTLIEGTDYLLSYSNNVKFGTATVSIEGTGEYRGCVKKHFTIKLGTAKLNTPTVTKSAIKVSWEPVAGAVRYLVYRREASNSDWSGGKLATLSSDTYAFTDKHTSTGKTYYYTVRAEASSAKINSYNKTGIGAIRMSAPVLTKMSMTGSGYFVVNWEDTKGADYYRIYRKTDGTDWVRLGEVKSNIHSWVDKTTKNGEYYTYTVRARAKVNANSFLSSYDSTGKSYYYMPRQSIESLTSPSSKHMKVVWTRNKHASGYLIQYSTNSNMSGAVTKQITKAGTYASTISVSKGGVYYVRVRSFREFSTFTCVSKWSPVLSVKVKK